MKKNYVLLTLMCLMFLSAFAQHKHQHIGGSCGSDYVNNQYFQNNPQAAAERDAFDAQLAQMAKMGKKFSSKNAQELYEIPIVVHIIHDGEDVGVGSNISDQQVINWVNYTNAVFAGTAVGVVNESSGGTTIPVKLVLAKRTEACTPTNGIVRANASGLSGYSANGLAFSSSPLGASEASIRNLSRWNPEAYYNVYLVKTITGTIGDTPLEVGGYAYSPNGSNEVYGTFMRVSTAVVGDITFPHEMAHSLGIHHTFQGTDSLGTDCPPIETDCNLEGDMICDTERIKSMASTYPIPSNSVINPCTGVNYANTQYNIMGYGSVNDRFTPEQKERAIAQLLQFRSGLLTSLGATEIDSNATPLALTPMCVPNSISIPGNYSIGPVKVTFGDLNVDSSPFRIGGEFYTDYSQSCLLNPTATIAGYEATELGIAIIGTNSQKLRAYIDWNNDGVFDAATETIYSVDSVTGITSPNNIANVLPPVYAVKNTPLRLRVIADLNSVTITPCYNPTYGQVEDYAVIVQETIQGCNGITSAIVASISENTATSGTQINLSATGVLGSDGVQYQWQKSTTGTGDWQNIASATSLFSIVTIEGSIGSTLYYRLKVKCVETQTESFSSDVSVEIIPNYCSAGTAYTGSLLISNVSFAEINNSSVATLGYENFSAISTDIQVGSTNAFSASSSQSIIYSNDKLNVWIDLNYDGDFDDEGELVLVKNGGSFSGNIIIPSNTSLGKKRMRIRVQREIGGYVSNYTPCGNADLGQVEDYTINIIDAGCSSIPETILASISSTEGAPGDTVELSSNVQESQGVVYQWQQSLPGMSSFEDIQNANTNTFSYTIGAEAGNTSFRLKVTCSVNQEVSYSDNVNYSASLNYCDPSELVSEFELISYVSFSDINNNSTSAIPYEDFTTLNANVFVGQTYPITVSGSNTFASDKVLVWIDFNRNGNFTDEGELVLNSATGHGPWNANITIPANAALGSTRMRVLLFDSDYNGGIPCSNQSTQDAYGQVEDYTLNIVDGTTVWNGNSWSLGEPTLTKMARIEGNLTMNTNLEAQQLKVTSSGSITIPSGFSLTVDGLIINEGYTTNFVVEHGGNLIQTTNAVNFGTITVKRNSNLMVRNDNTFWSSPVAEQSLRNFSTGTLYNRFWTYNENTNLFSSLFNNNSQDANFANGAGYAIRVTNSLPINQSIIHEGIFTGVPTNGTVNVSVVNSGIGDEDKGYNIIGNPYPSSILTSGATGFLSFNPNVEALYFWTHQYPVLPQGGYAGSNYATYTTLNIDQMPAIAVGQGFIIKAATSGNVVFNNQMRSPVTASAYSTNTVVEKHRVWLKLSKENQVLSETLVGYMTDATNEIDLQIDGKLIVQSSTTLYNVINQEKYAVQGRSVPFVNTDVVPMGINLTESGSFAIAIQNKDGLFAQGQSVFLKDNYLNVIHDLNQEYTFSSESGEFNNRFEIVYFNTVLDNIDFTKERITVYQAENNIIISSPNQNLKSVVLYDTLGRIMYQNNNINDTLHTISAATFGNQVLLLQASTHNGEIITKKLINK